MGQWFPLAIFPEGALASSVVTTVLVGVWVVVFFNLRFGWVLSGLVVPGYLAPLILMEPVSAGVIVVEAVVTYSIVRLMAVHFAETIGWTSFFGRDRFFALILVSVVVRLVFDAVLLPPVALWLNQHYDLGFDWTRDLESFGLIVIALFANQFWKTGMMRGFFTNLVCILITLAIVRFGLMELTNFRISDIGYLYELLAASLLASSKAYIILILTAFIASRINLRAGLDFNGLLIPALVALQWYEPVKILTSIGEALVILLLCSLLLRLRFYANKTIEGGRKILLFFNVSFAWKMLVGYGVLWAELDIVTSDAYGFGYLLSSLLALKLHDKGGAPRMLTALVAVSAQGAVIGTVVGFLFAEVSRAMMPIIQQPAPEIPVREALPRELLASAVQRSTYANQIAVAARPDTISLQNFREGLATLVTDLAPDASNLTDLVAARRKIAIAGFGVRLTSEGYVVVEPVLSRSGQAIYMINPASKGELTISLPDAAAARGLSSAAGALFELTDARGLILRGGDETSLENDTGTYFQTAHEVIGGAILQLTSDPDADRSTLEVAGRYPRSLDLPSLEQVTGEITLVSSAAVRSSPQRLAAESGFGLLDLTPGALHSLVAKIDGEEIFLDLGNRGLHQTIRGLAKLNENAPEAVPPDLTDLLYLEAELLAPLLDEALPRLRAEPKTDQATTDLLLSLDVAARSLGYNLRVVRDNSGEASHVILHSDRVSWGTFVLGVRQDRPIFIHVPSGLRDRRILNFGLSVFDLVGAPAILIAGRADRDGLPAPELNVLNPDHTPGLYDLMAKLLVQGRLGESATLVLRSVAEVTSADAPTAGIILSPDSILGDSSTSGLMSETVSELQDFGLSVALRQGTKDFAGFESGVIPQAGFLSARPEAEFLSLWLTPNTLNQFVDHLGLTTQSALFRQMGVRMQHGTLADRASTCVSGGAMPTQAIDDLRSYLDTGNPVALQSLLRPEAGLQAVHLSDLPSQQTFLILADRESNCLRAVVNLNPLSTLTSDTVVLSADDISAEELASFAGSRRALLTFREEEQ